MKSFFLGVLLCLFSGFAVSQPCIYDNRCNFCPTGYNRANLKITGVGGCVPCQLSCPIQGYLMSPETESTLLLSKGTALAGSSEVRNDVARKPNGQPVKVTDPNEELLIISFNGNIIQEVAAINPEAAYMMQIMNFLSLQPFNSMPSKADRYSPVLVSPPAVMIVQRDGLTTANIDSYVSDLTAKGHRSVISWSLKKKRDRAQLSLIHTIRDDAGNEVETIYPDIDIKLAWVTAKSGGTGGGYWSAVGWNQVQRPF